MVSAARRLARNIRHKMKDSSIQIAEDFRNKDEGQYFSQFGEDAVVQSYYKSKMWSKYGNSTKLDPGFYVDVGAFDPIEKSNTYWFYKRGWRGINIDATPGTVERFQSVRPFDTNLHLAVSPVEGSVDFYSWGQSVFNTLSEEVASARMEASGFLGKPQVVSVPAMRLDAMLNKYLREGQAISFLSVDVEGHDVDVLQTNDWSKYRPELVIVEEHINDVHAILDSDINRVMNEASYRMYAWTPPSIIFIGEETIEDSVLKRWRNY